MNPGFILSILAIIAIIVAASFGLHLLPIEPVHTLPDSVANHALFVCPVNSPTFDEIARQLSYIRKSLTIVFFFIFMVWLAMIGWSLYQNLLKDKFEEKSWKSIIFLGKILFWLTLVITILIHTPNHYRRVKLNGISGEFVLCESNNPASRPVYKNAIKPAN
ncbi:MAG: hypothetical protein GX944_01105 [Alphaproteobacteria bacterium]|jgi:uncharacterized membrane protein (DUF485 family)|nr:hypothetical protein [Alphaproteobacteria bacterium]